MHSLHSIGRIDRLLHVIRILEVGRQSGPFTAPGPNHHRVFVAPFGFQFIQGDLCGVEGGSLVNAFQVAHEGFLIFGRNVLHGVADLVDDAVLNLGVGVDGFDGLREAFQAIHAGNQNVFYTPVVQIGQHRQPVMSTFLIR